MSTPIDVSLALQSLVPNAQFFIEINEDNPKGDWNTLEWHDDEDCPSKEDVDAEIIKLEAEYDANEYARHRQIEYPSIEELTIALYDTDDKTALETKRAAVKTKWPKDNSGPV